MNKCNSCLHIGDMGSCQNFKSDWYGCDVTNKDSCNLIEIDITKTGGDDAGNS